MSVGFDRYIDVTLRKENGDETKIKTFAYGVKQEISVSGTFLPGTFSTNIELRIVNLYSDDFTNYKELEIEAGYLRTAGIWTPTKNAGVISGKIMNAFRESPGPDGVTVFQVLVGNYEAVNSNFALDIEEGEKLSAVLKKIESGYNAIDPLSQIKINTTPGFDKVIFPSVIKGENGNVKTHIERVQEIMRSTGPVGGKGKDCFLVTTEGEVFNCFFGNKEQDGVSDSAVVKRVENVSSPPRVDGGKFSFVAPWDPSLRCGDLIEINPAFARQSFGGAVANPFANGKSIIKNILMLSFDFSTTQETNKMTVQCLFEG